MTAAELPDTAEDRDFVTAVGRAFAVLRCFRRESRVLGNKDLALRTGMPKSTIARLTHTLTTLGYLEFLPAVEKYQLGIGVLALGQAYLAGLDVRDVARPLMQSLAEETQATVALGAPHGLHMVFLEICQGNPLFLLRVQVGERVPHGVTALGRAWIAAMSPEQREQYARDYRQRVPEAQWPMVETTSLQAVRDHAKHGFCMSLGDWNRDVYAVGVPMVSDDGQRILAFSISGPAREMTRKRLVEELGPRLMALRDRVRGLLGGQF